MKKELLIISFVLILSLSFVSADWFSDFFNSFSMSGKVVTLKFTPKIASSGCFDNAHENLPYTASSCEDQYGIWYSQEWGNNNIRGLTCEGDFCNGWYDITCPEGSIRRCPEGSNCIGGPPGVYCGIISQSECTANTITNCTSDTTKPICDIISKTCQPCTTFGNPDSVCQEKYSNDILHSKCDNIQGSSTYGQCIKGSNPQQCTETDKVLINGHPANDLKIAETCTSSIGEPAGDICVYENNTPVESGKTSDYVVQWTCDAKKENCTWYSMQNHKEKCSEGTKCKDGACISDNLACGIFYYSYDNVNSFQKNSINNRKKFFSSKFAKKRVFTQKININDFVEGKCRDLSFLPNDCSSVYINYGGHGNLVVGRCFLDLGVSVIEKENCPVDIDNQFSCNTQCSKEDILNRANEFLKNNPCCDFKLNFRGSQLGVSGDTLLYGETQSNNLGNEYSSENIQENGQKVIGIAHLPSGETEFNVFISEIWNSPPKINLECKLPYCTDYSNEVCHASDVYKPLECFDSASNEVKKLACCRKIDDSDLNSVYKLNSLLDSNPQRCKSSDISLDGVKCSKDYTNFRFSYDGRRSYKCKKEIVWFGLFSKNVWRGPK